MTAMTILGQSHDGDNLWVSLDGDEFAVHPVDLAVARRSDDRGYSAQLFGHWVDTEQITTLINAMNAPQPLYPTVACKYCGIDASVLIEDEPYCHPHAQGYTAREEGQ